MKLMALRHLTEVDPNIVENKATEIGANAQASLGIAEKILAEGDVRGLSSAQMYHYENVLSPLLNIECEGPVGRDDNGFSTCVNGEPLSDEDLIAGYIEDEFLCGYCRYRKEKHGL